MASPWPAGPCLADVPRALGRHKKKSVLFFFLVMAAVVAATAWWPRAYRSEGKLLVRLGRENAMLDPAATVGSEPTLAIPQDREDEINSVVELLRSRLLIEKVVERLGTAAVLGSPHEAETGPQGLAGAPHHAFQGAAARLATAARQCAAWMQTVGLSDPVSDFEQAVGRLAARLSVEPVKRSNVIRIGYEGSSPEASRTVVAAVIDCYLDEHLRLSRPDEARRFLAGEVAGLREQLLRKEQALRALKDQTRLAAPAEQRRILVDQIGRLEGELWAATGELAASKARVQALRRRQADTPPTRTTSYTEGHSNEGTDGMREQLYALQLVEQKLQAKYTEAHPLLQEVRQQVAQAQAVLEQEPPSRTQTTTGVNRAYEEAELTLLAEEPKAAALGRQAEVLRGQLAALEERARRLNGAELQVASVQREVDLLEARYRKYSLSLEQARMDESLASERIGSIRVAQPATLEMRPVRPRVAANLALGALIAAAGAIALALAAEGRRRRPQDAHRVEQQQGANGKCGNSEKPAAARCAV